MNKISGRTIGRSSLKYEQESELQAKQQTLLGMKSMLPQWLLRQQQAPLVPVFLALKDSA